MDYQEFFERGVVHPGHPPVIEAGIFGAQAKALKAGTILKLNGTKYEAAGESDTPCAALLEDMEAHTEDQRAFVLRHGIAVRSRLIDASGEGKAAGDTLTGKLPVCGIYLAQGGWTDSNFS